MTHFVSLSNELTREILKLVQSEDLEKFAQISRNVFRLAVPFLHEHRALFRKYYTLRNNLGPGSISILLNTVIANPRNGSYVKKILLRPLRIGVDSVDVYTKEGVEIFTTAALDSQCLQKPLKEDVLDERGFWSNAI